MTDYVLGNQLYSGDGVLGFQVYVPTPPTLSTGQHRLFRARIEIAGGSTYYVVPMNWQANWRYGLSTYLTINFHNPDTDMLDALNDALGDSPGSAVTMTMEIGARTGFDTDTDTYGDLMTVDLTTIRDDEGVESYSARLEGYATYTNGYPASVTLPAGVYRSSTLGVFRWRGGADFSVKPGDQATITGVGNPVVIGSIYYNVNDSNATMEIGELTNSTYLTALGW